MGIFGPSWSERARQDARDRKSMQRARALRARQARAANRRHMIEHPVGHMFGKLFGR